MAITGPSQQQVNSGTGGGTSIAVTITTPTVGDALFLIFANGVVVTVSSISGGGVTWNKIVGSTVHSNTEIWAGYNSSGSGTTITVNCSGTITSSMFAIFLEFTGVNTKDATGTNSISNSVAPSTTAVIQGNYSAELFIAAVSFLTSSFSSGPTNSFIASTVSSGTQVRVAYLITSSTGTQSTSWSAVGRESSDNVIASFYNLVVSSSSPQSLPMVGVQ